MLNNVSEFIEYISQHSYILSNKDSSFQVKSYFCDACRGERRFWIKSIFYPSKKVYEYKSVNSGIIPISNSPPERITTINQDTLPPSLFELKCSQCDFIISALICKRNGKTELLLIHSTFNDVGTEHTKKEVSFYLDQAYKCQMMGAYSAGISMYRGALEMLLYLEGYTKGMLAEKISILETQIKEGIAPTWAKHLDVEILRLFKSLGNYSIHPNDGDISKQKTFDEDLVKGIKILFNKLLDIVYELHLRDKALKESLRDAEKQLKKL